MDKKQIGVLGAGGWGIALAILLQENGHQVTIWSILKEEVKVLKERREHDIKLKGIHIPENIQITNSIEEVVQGKDVLVFAVPSSFVRSTAHLIKDIIEPNQVIVNVAKGFENDTLMTLQEVINDELKNAKVAILSGPSHAEEVAKGIPTSVSVASFNKDIIHNIQDMFINDNFRVYGCEDVVGVEIGGAFKNVIALAAGISDGLGFGDNTKAALMTRGMAEISRLGEAMGAKRQTFNGLTGVGDLIVTCTSMHSRNRRAGILIGKGYSLEEAMKEIKMTVEGAYAVQAGVKLGAKYQVELPIIEKIYSVLFEGKDPKEGVIELMCRDKKYEM